MAMSQAAYSVEKAIGHDTNNVTAQDVSTFPSGGKDDYMNALVWMGKNKVEIGMFFTLSSGLRHPRAQTNTAQ